MPPLNRTPRTYPRDSDYSLPGLHHIDVHCFVLSEFFSHADQRTGTRCHILVVGESLDMFTTINHSKTPVTPEWRPYSVSTAFKKNAERRGARCANASNAVQTLWKRCAIA